MSLMYFELSDPWALVVGVVLAAVAVHTLSTLSGQRRDPGRVVGAVTAVILAAHGLELWWIGGGLDDPAFLGEPAWTRYLATAWIVPLAAASQLVVALDWLAHTPARRRRLGVLIPLPPHVSPVGQLAGASRRPGRVRRLAWQYNGLLAVGWALLAAESIYDHTLIPRLQIRGAALVVGALLIERWVRLTREVDGSAADHAAEVGQAGA